MPKSPVALEFDGFQKALKPFLKQRGFRVRSRTFNRLTNDGLTQVINFQMGRFDPPGTTYIPDLRENLYGRFTVNLGVYVPEVDRISFGDKKRGFIQEYNCCVNSRLGELGPEKGDVWWKISGASSLVGEIEKRLERDALPFLDHYESRDVILKACIETGDEIDNVIGAPRIVAAIILVERGDADTARRLLIQQAQEPGNPAHTVYVCSLAEKLGLGKLEVVDA